MLNVKVRKYEFWKVTSSWPIPLFVFNKLFITQNVSKIAELHRIHTIRPSADISDQYRNVDIEVISEWHIQLGVADVKMRYISDMEWSTSFRQRNSIAQIAELHQIYINLTSVAISSHHWNGDIEIISKWYIYLGFANLEISRIVSFHNDFPSSGEQFEQRKLAQTL